MIQMKKTFEPERSWIRSLLFAFVSVLAGTASASQITFVSVTGNWHDANG